MMLRASSPRPLTLRSPIFGFLALAILLAASPGCVGPDNKPMAGVPIRKQYKIAGTAAGAGVGFAIARAIGANQIMTMALTGGGAFLGNRIGDNVGERQQEKYDTNMARDAMVARRITRAENDIAAAKAANARLNQNLKRLRTANRAATAVEIREQDASTRRMNAQVTADLLSIEEGRRRARNLGLKSETANLEKKRDQLQAQNDLYRRTVSQIKTTGGQ